MTFNIRIEKYYITGKRGWHIYISQVLEQNFALSGIVSNDCTNTYTMYRVPGTQYLNVDEIKIATVMYFESSNVS